MSEPPANALLIREYKPSDLPVLHAMDAVCFAAGIAFSHSELYFHLNHRHSIARIAELGGVIAGFAVGRLVAPASAHVLTLDVAPASRRSGIATALMNALHEEFRRLGARSCVLEVDVENAAARQFYKRLGYIHVETLPGYYNGQGDALRMVCSFPPNEKWGRNPISGSRAFPPV